MDCENYWSFHRSLDPLRSGIGAKIIRRRRVLSRVHWILWVVFIVLQVADVVSTNYALTIPGNREVNPIMHLSQTHLGAAWWLPKVVAIGFAAVAVPQTLRPWPILFAVWYYVIVVSGNLAAF